MPVQVIPVAVSVQFSPWQLTPDSNVALSIISKSVPFSVRVYSATAGWTSSLTTSLIQKWPSVMRPSGPTMANLSGPASSSRAVPFMK